MRISLVCSHLTEDRQPSRINEIVTVMVKTANQTLGHVQMVLVVGGRNKQW
jgi:hypothetical protein